MAGLESRRALDGRTSRVRRLLLGLEFVQFAGGVYQLLDVGRDFGGLDRDRIGRGGDHGRGGRNGGLRVVNREVEPDAQAEHQDRESDRAAQELAVDGVRDVDRVDHRLGRRSGDGVGHGLDDDRTQATLDVGPGDVHALPGEGEALLHVEAGVQEVLPAVGYGDLGRVDPAAVPFLVLELDLLDLVAVLEVPEQQCVSLQYDVVHG